MIATLPLVLALAGAPQAAAQGCTPPGATLLQESAGSAFLHVDGGDVVADCTFPVTLGTSWLFDLTVETTEGPQDQVLVTGTVTHAAPPHGEGANPTALVVSERVDASPYPTGTFTRTFSATVPHGDHDDRIEGTITFEVFFEEIFDLHLIFDYDVDVAAFHTATVPALPAGLAWLLAVVVAAVGARLVRARSGHAG